MPIQAAALLLDILLDFSSRDCRKVRRRKNAFDDIGGRTGSLVEVEQRPGGASTDPKDSGLLGDRIEPSPVNAPRISSSFEACFAFAWRFFLVPRISVFSPRTKKVFA